MRSGENEANMMTCMTIMTLIASSLLICTGPSVPHKTGEESPQQHADGSKLK